MMITTQAPDRNFELATITAMTPVVAAPRPLIAKPSRQPGSRRCHQRRDHARLRKRERDEDAHRVERDQGGHAGVEDDQQEGGHRGQGDDARW